MFGMHNEYTCLEELLHFHFTYLLLLSLLTVLSIPNLRAPSQLHRVCFKIPYVNSLVSSSWHYWSKTLGPCLFPGFLAARRWAVSSATCCCHGILLTNRPKTNRANQMWIEITRQYKPFIFLSWLSWVFCHSNGKLTNTLFKWATDSISLSKCQWHSSTEIEK